MRHAARYDGPSPVNLASADRLAEIVARFAALHQEAGRSRPALRRGRRARARHRPCAIPRGRGHVVARGARVGGCPPTGCGIRDGSGHARHGYDEEEV